MTRDEAVKMLQATRLMLTDGANQPISDLYYALDMAIEALEQTEPTNSEKPNNSTGYNLSPVVDEPQTEDLQDWKDRMWAEAVEASKTEPQTIRCPKCGRSDYIREFGKDFSVTAEGAGFKYKCINCNTYIEPQTEAWQEPFETERSE